MSLEMSDHIEPRLHVSVYSDYTCPWCYVGWARFEKALARLPSDVVAEVLWRPFEIHPGVPQEGMPVEDLPYSRERWDRMTEALREAAATEGLEVGNRPKVSNTHRALVASTYAQAVEPERFAAFHEALFKGYFAEGRDLGDPEVIRSLASETGLDVRAMEDAIETGRYEDELAETTGDARRYGITGTPTFVFEGRYALAGAQPVELLLRALERVLEEVGGQGDGAA